ncbi:ATP-binding protein [Pyxidicoccus parkwayensis]|uniref:ATP-binding protein n=1 Tax=Pyxidicoccus parkwayensis TaxID=2813578 RepID=A0ABX7P414_9BACT|nr:ATP-binding protein [Pyxidicoccus parkwaysis]QSQ25186.1 ATP-binding protein [Pyxidicoccus parkwaysis]
MQELRKYIQDWDGLMALVVDGITEGAHLDFKRDAYSDPRKPQKNQDEDREELRRDAASFANNGGGVLLIGVDEDAQGRAGSIAGIPRPLEHESFVREVLSRFIEPPLTSLQVQTIFAPQDSTRGVVVVQIGEAEPGLPHAVQGKGDGPLDFWIRTDKSKRRMMYLQVRASFRIGDTTITQQSVDALAISEIHKIGYALDDAREEDESRSLELLEELRFYVSENRYGYKVQAEVIEAAGQALHYPRAGISAQVAEEAVNIIKAALPSFHMQVPSRRKITEEDLRLLQLAEMYGHALAYDGAKYLKDLSIISIGSRLMSKLLRISHLNGFDGIKESLLDEFERIREIAAERNLGDAVKVLDYLRDSAFEKAEGPYVPEPKGLEWAIFGWRKLRVQPPSKPRSLRKPKSPQASSSRTSRPRSK